MTEGTEPRTAAYNRPQRIYFPLVNRHVWWTDSAEVAFLVVSDAEICGYVVDAITADERLQNKLRARIDGAET